MTENEDLQWSLEGMSEDELEYHSRFHEQEAEAIPEKDELEYYSWLHEQESEAMHELEWELEEVSEDELEYYSRLHEQEALVVAKAKEEGVDLVFESRRVAVAFGVEEWGVEERRYSLWCSAFVGAAQIQWAVSFEMRGMSVVSIGELDSLCQLSYDHERSKYIFIENSQYHELMARGLFCLGFEHKDVLAELNYPLTAHEQIELRLSMPRKFWPQKWLDEVKDQQV